VSGFAYALSPAQGSSIVPPYSILDTQGLTGRIAIVPAVNPADVGGSHPITTVTDRFHFQVGRYCSRLARDQYLTSYDRGCSPGY